MDEERKNAIREQAWSDAREGNRGAFTENAEQALYESERQLAETHLGAGRSGASPSPSGASDPASLFVDQPNLIEAIGILLLGLASFALPIFAAQAGYYALGAIWAAVAVGVVALAVLVLLMRTGNGVRFLGLVLSPVLAFVAGSQLVDSYVRDSIFNLIASPDSWSNRDAWPTQENLALYAQPVVLGVSAAVLLYLLWCAKRWGDVTAFRASLRRR